MNRWKMDLKLVWAKVGLIQFQAHDTLTYTLNTPNHLPKRTSLFNQENYSFSLTLQHTLSITHTTQQTHYTYSSKPFTDLSDQPPKNLIFIVLNYPKHIIDCSWHCRRCWKLFGKVLQSLHFFLSHYKFENGVLGLILDDRVLENGFEEVVFYFSLVVLS